MQSHSQTIHVFQSKLQLGPNQPFQKNHKIALDGCRSKNPTDRLFERHHFLKRIQPITNPFHLRNILNKGSQ